MFIFTYTAAILAIFCFGFAAFLLFENRKDLLARYLAYYILAVSVWVGANSVADVATTPGSLIFWGGLAFIGASLFVSFYLCFVHAFVRRKRPTFGYFLAYFAATIIIVPGAFSKYSVSATFFPPDQPTQIVPGTLYAYGYIYLMTALLYALIELALFYRRKATPTERMQILYMEAGFLFLFFGLVLFGYVLPLVGELRFFNVGPQFSVIMLGFTSYAILRHRLLDIKVVIQKSVVYSLLLGMIALAYLAALGAALLFTDNLTSLHLTAAFATTAIGIFLAPPLKRFFEKKTDRFFFKHRYIYSEAVDELSRVLNQHLKLEELVDGIAAALKTILKVRRVDVIILDRPVPYDDKVPLETRADIIRSLGTGLESLVPTSTDLIVPVILKHEIIALIGLAEKLSHDPFFADDLQLLRSFAYQAAVAIEKARLYHRVQEYSERLEEKVERRTAEIKSLHETQAHMIIDISHGLQTPLTVIRGQIEAAKSAGAGWPGLPALEKSIEKISGFIQRLLRLAVLDSPENAHKDDVELSSLLDDIISYFGVVAQQQKISVETEVAKDLHVCGSRSQLEEMILNILSNAAKFIAGDRRIAISLGRDGGNAVLTVRDTGVGIAKEDLDKVFRRFYRPSESRDTAGYGLGLAICKKIVEIHRGTIALESTKGQGTTVTVALPLISASTGTEPCDLNLPSLPAGTPRSKTI